jgi:hypothetical protein
MGATVMVALVVFGVMVLKNTLSAENIDRLMVLKNTLSPFWVKYLKEWLKYRTLHAM